MNKTVAKIKRINSSPLFLIAALSFTLAIIVMALSSTSVPAALQSVYAAATHSQPVLASIEKQLLPAFGALPAAIWAQSALALVVALGMWLHFFANKSRSGSVSTLGLTLIKVVKGIELAALIIVFALIAVFGVMTALVLIEAWKEAFEVNMTIAYSVLGVAGLLYVLVFAFIVMYYRGIFRTIKSVKMTLSTGVIMGKVSMYVIVMNYILAICTLAGAVLSPSVLMMAGGLLNVISLVTLSLALSQLRTEMQYISIRGGEAAEK